MLPEILWAALDQVQIHLEVRSTDPPYLVTPFPKLEDPTAQIQLTINYKFGFQIHLFNTSRKKICL